ADLLSSDSIYVVLRRSGLPLFFSIFFFTDPPTTQIYTLSLHDALPISADVRKACGLRARSSLCNKGRSSCFLSKFLGHIKQELRSEEHTSELQSLAYLV